MNTFSNLRKLVQSGNGSATGNAVVNSNPPRNSSSATDQEYALHLQHLRKVFRECLAKSAGGSVGIGQDDRLYSLIPIFVKIESQFPDLSLFGSAVSKLLVHEIKKRAGDRSSEGASLAIVEYLKPSDFSPGWMLLSSLQILSCSSSRLVDMLCSAALPSTLLKIFYLFFDLPITVVEQESNVLQLATVTCEIFCNLMRNAAAADELAKKDVMVLLFIASTSPCPAHNVTWRKCCQEGLCCMARHSLTELALGYIHAKGCLKICVDNMKNVHQLDLMQIFSIFQYFSVFVQEAFNRSQTMIDDFRIAQGFVFIIELGLRIEERLSDQPGIIEQFIAILKEMCVHGPADLKCQVSQGLFRLVSFQLPIPKGPPFSIRSLDAFYCLQELFLRCQNMETAKCCLLAINELCVWDDSNYFITDTAFSTLSVFTSKIGLLSVEGQSIYFNLLRHVVIELNHVPSKELSSLALVVRDSPMDCTFFKMALLSLKRILLHDITFQDVYRDVGLVEILTRRFITADSVREFPLELLDVFQSVLKQNNQNCHLFRDSGSTPRLLKLIITEEGIERSSLLLVLQHLLTSVGCDDDIQHLLTAFNNIKNEYSTKRDLLLCLCGAMRESHRARIAFRKSGAFVSLISAIVALEGKFRYFDPQIAVFLNDIFETITTAMRYEPSNAKHFATEIRFQALSDACRLLGCFSSDRLLPLLLNDPSTSDLASESSFPCFFRPTEHQASNDQLDASCFVLRCLYLMALDGYRHGWADNFDSLLNDASIVYTGAVLVILDLLPAIPLSESKSNALLIFTSEILKSLVRQERNQQLMCEAGMVQHLLTICESAIADENHILNPFLQYILERLAAQSLRPRELRNLLRLRFFSSGYQLPLSRIKTLVSMISLKDLQKITPPAFVEFDLSYEGFGGLYLPSIAPQASPTFSLHNTLSSVDSAGGVGGIGSGVRVFPPAAPGLSVVIWFCVDSFVSMESIRLLDITRHLVKPQDSMTCLSIHLVEFNQQLKLLVTTREHNAVENPEYDGNEGDVITINMDFLREQECVWHCLTVSMGKSLVKSGYCNLYLDDRSLGQFKLASIPQNPGGGAATLTTAASISATIGTQPIQRRPCRLRWKLASLFLLEDVLSHPQVQIIYALGPSYHGTFQDPQSSAMNITEEKVLFGFNPLMATEMSIAKIRRIFNKDDAKAIAKHLALSSHDASTPVKIIHNSAAHLRGSSRAIGAAVVGYLGVRVFVPKPPHQALLPIGGIWSLLGMVAMAPDTEHLYASMKCLYCALRTNGYLREQMTGSGGFQLVAMMLKKKKDFLNSHVLQLAFSMTFMSDMTKEGGGQVPEKKPLEDLLSDIQLWLACSTDLQRSLFEHFMEFSKDSNTNAKILCECGLIKKIFQFLLMTASSDSLDPSVLGAAGDLLWYLLCSSGKSNSDILCFGQYLICTIPSSLESVQNPSVAIRNLGLKIMRSLCDTYGDLMSSFLGFDWILSFLHPALHSSSLYQVCELFCHLLISSPANMLAFRESKNVGRWLRDSATSRKRADALRLIPSHQSSLQANLEVVTVSGFFALQSLMPELSDVSISWLSMLSILLGKKANMKVDLSEPLTLDLVWQHVFNAAPGTTIKFRDGSLCSDAMLVIFNMVRKSVQAGEGGNATCVLQVVIYMYHNWSEFGQLALTSDFIGGLVACLFTLSEEEPEFIVQPSPTRRLVLDLLRMLISDSLALPSEKFNLLTTAWLEGHPEKCPPQAYQVEMSEMMMDHISALNLITNTSAMWIHPSGNRNNVATNIFNFAQKLVEKIWRKQVVKLDKALMTFLLHNMESWVSVHESSPTTDLGFAALNRLIIFQVTRPSDSVSSQMFILDALHGVVDHRAIVFHSSNSDVIFFVSLAYCLSMIVDRMPINCDTSTSSSWHTYPEMSSQILEGWQLLQTAACSVWNVMLQTKKRELWEYMRPPRAVLESDLPDVKDFVRESGSKAWTSFLEDSGRRHMVSGSSTSTGVSMASVKGLPHSLVRAYSRQKSTKQVVPPIKISAALYLHQLRLHCLLVKQYVQDQLSHLQRSMGSLHRLVEDEWLVCENEFLLRERSLFGPEEAWPLEKWQLDMSEGPQRVRKKLIRNTEFYTHYPCRDVPLTAGVNDARQRMIRYPVSADSKLFMESREGHIKTLLRTSRGAAGVAALGSISQSGDSAEPKALDIDDNSEDAKEDDRDGDESDDTVIRRLIETGDTITYAFRCARVEGLDAYEGLMLLGKEHFYLIDGYTLLSTREIRDIESIPVSQREPVLPSVILGKRRRQKFHYEEIREVLNRRYLLQPIGIEIFCTNGRTNLLAFPRDISNRVYSRLLAIAPNITDSAMQSVAGQKRSAQVEPNSGILNSLMGEKSVTERWVRGEISNFQYLMFLNTLSGRSYNDLMQYPVFPWILADYDSPVLDLTNPASFRDLSKPMGAQTEDRLEQYLKRFREWDPNTKDSPFIYGTHYSTAMIVASYLLRLEPFTQYFLHLQGGHFDLADRMFHSIKDAWLSASTNNMADVKELIPEFFYLPDFLLNTNKFDLGTKQSGTQLDHVVLPPWAKGDPREFIRIHRQALESDYVSSHLHEFIDLVWGCKQRGQAAIEANNLFHSWMYEGVDLEKLADPLEKQAFIAFINNFGQVPSQIFKKPHPVKKVTGQRSDCLYHNLEQIHPLLTHKELRSPVGCIIPLERGCLPLEQNKTPVPPHANRYLAWGFPDHSLRICSFESDRPTAVFEIRDEEEVLCAVCATSDMFLIAGMSGIISVYNLTTSKRLVLSKHLYGHYEPVTCLVASSVYSLGLTGSKDRTCIVWDLENLSFIRSLKGHPVTVSAVGINDLTGDMGTCAGTLLYYWDINGVLLAMVDIFEGQALPNDQILCIAFSQLQEWDDRNVVVVGGTDGCIRFFSEQLTQCDQPSEMYNQMLTQEADTEESDPIITLRRLSIHGSVSGAVANPRSAVRLQDTEDLPSPTRDVGHHEENFLPSETVLKTVSKPPPTIVVNKAKENQLHRRLVLQRQVDVQKAIQKKSPGTAAVSKGQLSITALAFSKDHKVLHVGDSQGRVSSWLPSSERTSKS